MREPEAPSGAHGAVRGVLSPAGLRAAFVAAAVEGVILYGHFLFLFLLLVARALVAFSF